jgi:hypothetical protein
MTTPDQYANIVAELEQIKPDPGYVTVLRVMVFEFPRSPSAVGDDDSVADYAIRHQYLAEEEIDDARSSPHDIVWVHDM